MESRAPAGNEMPSASFTSHCRAPRGRVSPRGHDRGPEAVRAFSAALQWATRKSLRPHHRPAWRFVRPPCKNMMAAVDGHSFPVENRASVAIFRDTPCRFSRTRVGEKKSPKSAKSVQPHPRRTGVPENIVPWVGAGCTKGQSRRRAALGKRACGRCLHHSSRACTAKIRADQSSGSSNKAGNATSVGISSRFRSSVRAARPASCLSDIWWRQSR